MVSPAICAASWLFYDVLVPGIFFPYTRTSEYDTYILVVRRTPYEAKQGCDVVSCTTFLLLGCVLILQFCALGLGLATGGIIRTTYIVSEAKYVLRILGDDDAEGAKRSYFNAARTCSLFDHRRFASRLTQANTGTEQVGVSVLSITIS